MPESIGNNLSFVLQFIMDAKGLSTDQGVERSCADKTVSLAQAQKKKKDTQKKKPSLMVPSRPSRQRQSRGAEGPVIWIRIRNTADLGLTNLRPEAS